MYMPGHFEESRIDVLHALVRGHPLATWVVQGADGLNVNHVPFLVDATRGEHGTLVGHVARANPVWQRLGPSIAVFQGPQAYISPNWYPSKRAHGKVVPTWNYAVVHAHGTPRAIESHDELLAIVTRLTQTHEADSAVPWAVSDAPADYLEQMLKAIVGIEIPIDRLEGKWKVSQNRALPDRLGTVAGLRQRGDAQSEAMAALVTERSEPTSGKRQ
jgi:transcriptional regulator